MINSSPESKWPCLNDTHNISCFLIKWHFLPWKQGDLFQWHALQILFFDPPTPPPLNARGLVWKTHITYNYCFLIHRHLLPWKQGDLFKWHALHILLLEDGDYLLHEASLTSNCFHNDASKDQNPAIYQWWQSNSMLTVTCSLCLATKMEKGEGNCGERKWKKEGGGECPRSWKQMWF